MPRFIELRRHTDSDGDVLTDEGVAAALRLGASLAGGYQLGVSTGAQRATQTLACMLAALGQPVPGGVVVEAGLRSEREDDWRRASQQAGSGDLAALRAADPALVAEDSARGFESDSWPHLRARFGPTVPGAELVPASSGPTSRRAGGVGRGHGGPDHGLVAGAREQGVVCPSWRRRREPRLRSATRALLGGANPRSRSEASTPSGGAETRSKMGPKLVLEITTSTTSTSQGEEGNPS